MLARGWDKSQQASRMKRAEVRRVYDEVTSEGSWPDVYGEVAKRLGVGRTTVYHHLKSAGGVIDGRKR